MLPNRFRYGLSLFPILLILILAACSANRKPNEPPTPTVALPVLPTYRPGDTQSAHVFLPESSPGVPYLRFERISSEQGLSMNTVRLIMQDHQGLLWFGTEEGLNRYDGYNWVSYRPDPDDPHSLSNPFTLVLYEDRSGTLWTAGVGGGLDRYDRSTGGFVHYRHDRTDPSSIAGDFVSDVYEDSTNVLWVATDQGLDQFDRAKDGFVHVRDFPPSVDFLGSGSVRVVRESRTGQLWFGTASGLVRYDRGTREYVQFRNVPSDPASLSSDKVYELFEDSKGTLWVGTYDGGLNRLAPGASGFVRYSTRLDDPNSLSHNLVTSICEDRSGRIWVGTYGGGLNLYNPATDGFIHYRNNPNDPSTLSDDFIFDIMEDKSGVLWLAMQTGGLSKYAPESSQFVHYHNVPGDTDTLTNSPVMALYQDRSGALWIGTYDGLDKLDRQTGRYVHYGSDPSDPSSLSHRLVRAIYQDRAGVLWVGTEGGGLNRIDPGSDKFVRYPTEPNYSLGTGNDTVSSFYEDPSGVLWIGTNAGLVRRETDGYFTHYQADDTDPPTWSNHPVYTLHAARGGILWVGTSRGLNRLDLNTGKTSLFLHDPQDPWSLSESAVMSILEDSKGRLWVGTMGGGLNRMDTQTGAFTHYREKQGLPNDTVVGLLEDDAGLLWLSTNRGLARFDPETEKFECFDVTHGLQSNEFSWGAFYKNSQGEFFFGGIKGFNAFFPGEIQDNRYVPPIVLTALSQEGQALLPGRPVEDVHEITLAWPKNGFEFEFAALNYVQPQKNQHAYRLEGFEQNWNLIGSQHSGRFTNLPGGTFALRLIGSNNDGVWNGEGTTLRVNVVPPLWETFWFRGALLISFALAGVIAYRLRVSGIKQRNRELQAQIEERTRALTARTRELEERTLDLEKQDRRLEALYGADEAMHRHLELDLVLKALVDVAVDVCHADKSSALIWDEETERWTGCVARGFSPATMELLRFRRDEGIIGEVGQKGLPVFVMDATRDPRAEHERADVVRAVVAEGIGSFMEIPILLGGRVFAIFNVNFSRPGAFGEDEKRLFLALGQRAARAIENARLFHAEQRRAEQFRFMSQIGHDITSILGVDELLNEIVRAIQAAFGYYLVGIALIEDDGLVIKASVPGPWQPKGMPLRRLKVGKEGVMGRVAATGEPSLVPDVSRDPAFIAWPDNIPTRSELAVPLKCKSGVIGVLNVESDRLNAFDESDLAVLQSIGSQAAIAIENAQHFRTEQRRTEQFRVIGEVGRDITALRAVDELLVETARLIQEVFNYYHVGFGLIQGNEVVYRAGAGALANDTAFQFSPPRLAVGKEGITGWVAETGEPLLVPDVRREPRYIKMEGSQTLSELIVPIKVKERVIGVLDAQSDRLNAFDETDMAVLQSLANQVGAAIENARLYAQAQQVAAMEERNRLARDLHDAVTQTLFSATLIADALPASWESDPEEGRQLLRELRQLSRGALAEMRTLLLELRPATLTETNLATLLKQLGEAAAGRGDLSVTVDAAVDCKLPPPVHVALYRIAQEALNNVVKHSRATKVTVTLHGIPGEPKEGSKGGIVLEITDDGRGFDLARVPSGHLGLGIMRERAQAIGATLSVESRPGCGTQIKVESEKSD